MRSNAARDVYRRALAVVRTIENPTFAQLQAACPHLSAGQVRALMCERSIYVALPPLRITRSYQIGYYERNPGGATFKLSDRSGRAAESYVQNGDRPGTLDEYPYMAAAMEYSQHRWPEMLVKDAWAEVAKLYLQQPIESGGSEIVRTIWLALRQEVSTLNRAFAKPAFVAWDDALMSATTNPEIGSELIGDRQFFIGYSCAGCGAGIDIGRCPGCGTHFESESGPVGSPVMLPAKVAKLVIASGYDFAEAPASVDYELRLAEH